MKGEPEQTVPPTTVTTGKATTVMLDTAGVKVEEAQPLALVPITLNKVDVVGATVFEPFENV